MGQASFIIRLMQLLESEKIIGTNQFFNDFARKQFEHYNRFEKLSLDKKQKEKIENRILWRYEYRNSSNFRCIFINGKGQYKDIIILLCAFNENGTKKNGKNSYKANIQRAIDMIVKNDF